MSLVQTEAITHIKNLTELFQNGEERAALKYIKSLSLDQLFSIDFAIDELISSTLIVKYIKALRSLINNKPSRIVLEIVDRLDVRDSYSLTGQYVGFKAPVESVEASNLTWVEPTLSPQSEPLPFEKES